MSASLKLLAVLTLFAGTGPAPAEAKGFLMDPSRKRAPDARAFQRDLEAAMGEAMGCGGELGQGRLDSLEQSLLPIWQTLPKNGYGRIEWRALRYLAHRYFNGRSSINLRAFGPGQHVNQTSWGKTYADYLSVPEYVAILLGSNHARDYGFDLKDSVQIVAVFEQLLHDSESARLQDTYFHQKKPESVSLSSKGLQQVLEEYMMRWLLFADPEGLQHVLKKPADMSESVPNWSEIIGFVKGQVKMLDFQRYRFPLTSSRPKHNPLAPKYSLEDARHVVNGITQSFASYWEAECADMKTLLVSMDPLKTGRVPLSRFYNFTLEVEWRFAESESYLRKLGALDETSSWQGKQVIIANYIQGTSNCIVASEHYTLCCINECTVMMGEIEKAIAAPLASPEQVLAVVGNMTSQTTVDHDEPPVLRGSLTGQLEQIASAHHGKVPIHGRLFAQWLHYAFPHECAFPHKTGDAEMLLPHEFGDGYMATEGAMKAQVREVPLNHVPSDVEKDELEWMSQWSYEEELVSDYIELQARQLPSRMVVLGGGAVFLVCALVGVVGRGGKDADACTLPKQRRTHFV